MKRFAFVAAALIAFAAATPPAGAQSASPSPSPAASAGATYDGRYTGTSTSSQGCHPADFDLTVKNNAVTGTASFKSYSRGSEHTFVYDATGTVGSDATVNVTFHSDDPAMSSTRATFPMSGKAAAAQMSLAEGGETCGIAVTLLRHKD